MSQLSPFSAGSTNLGVIHGIPALELLEGLGELHESVVVCDRSGRVLWTSHAIDHLAGGRAETIDKPLADLCQRFVDTSSPGPRSEDSDFEKLSERLEHVLDRLENQETVVQFGLTSEPAIELSAFGVESRLEERGFGSNRPTLSLYIVILRVRRTTPLSHAAAHTLLDRHPEATLTLDPRGFVTWANPVALELLGSPSSRVIDSPITAHLPLLAIPGTTNEEAKRNGGSESLRRVIEFETGTKAGRWIEVSRRALPTGRPEEAAGWMLCLRDLSREQRAIHRLTRKVRSLEAYVHTVSHDLRSPLVSLLGFTRLLKKEHTAELNPGGRRFLDRIEQAGSNMNRMIRDLLELSKRDPESIHDKPLVDPRAVLLEIEAELKPRLQASDIHLHLPAAPPMIQCERTPLYQIFSNLIGNAVLHMGEVDEPRIEVSIAQAPNKRILIVEDNGRGIEPAAHTRIFDAFESIPRPNAEPSTGVGLSIVKKIAQAHGGHVEVSSSPGEGATFSVVLPHD